ncbi:MAG: SH3 domain-containing protein [Ignavibacteria bacterium]|jgi:hypothetical protein
MKKRFTLFAVLFTFLIRNLAFASSYDTTFKANLFESIKSNVKISLYYEDKYKNYSGKFTLTIDGICLTDSNESVMDYFETKVVDLDKDDDYKEIAITTYFNDNTEYNLYRFTGKKIISLGLISSMDEPVLVGDGTVKTKGWMGFWSYEYEFVLNKSKMKYEPVYKDEYPVNFYEGFEGDIVVKEIFNTYKEKDLKSEIVTKFKPGDKIKLIKAYTKVKCDDEYKDFCFWYLIEDKNGKIGWLQLKDFQDKVEGIPWAG